jgi:hypothetical protein
MVDIQDFRRAMLNGLVWCEECSSEDSDGVVVVSDEVEGVIRLLLDFPGPEEVVEE